MTLIVDVLIRSLGRVTLGRAISSIQAQSYKDWRIVLVDASGKGAVQALCLPQLTALDSTQLTFLEPDQKCSRSQAANLLLEQVSSDYVLFLDDDDWICPDHLERLVRALKTHSDCIAAYSDTWLRINDKEQHVYQRTFNRITLEFENYLPIHSVLFRATVLGTPHILRFNLQLQLFEDWFFWLQMSEIGNFVRVPHLSAVYEMNSKDGSRHAQNQDNQRVQMLRVFAQLRQSSWNADKWLEYQQWFLENQKSQTQAIQSLDRQLLDHIHLSEMAQAENVQLHHQLEMAQAELRAVYRSRSWRLTAPLRGVVARSKRVYSLIRPAVWFRFQLGVLMLLRRHGLIGFIRRIPGYLQHFPSYWKIQVNILSQTRSVEGWQQLFAPKYLPHPISLHPDLHGNKVPIASSVSVVIPTLNAGVEFFFLLKKLRMQKGLRHIEIVIVDSGSSDNTVALAKASDCKVVEIEPENFSHSHARNLGAMHASGDYLLFMVQDAYPIGEFWIYGLVKFLVEHQADRLAAVSCSEYSRSDSDVMYDSMIQTHYRFLNCLTQDRLGRLVGQDHMSLRSQGQLSDVACLILRKRFIVYGYRNDYAEDLDLGIRLINDGYSVAMLASIKVVHSHNRSAYYYLKRSFVDVIFLVNKFSDFVVPSCNDLIPFLCGYLRTAQIVSDWIAASGGIGGQLAAQNLSDAPHKPDAIIDQWIKAHRTMAARKFSAESWRAPDLKDAALNNFLVQVIEYCKFYETLDHQAVFAQEQSFMDAFIARLDHLNQYIGQLQAHLDERIIGEIEGGIIKTLAATMGGLLGFAYVNRASLPPEQIPFLERLHGQLKAGI